MSQSLQFAGSLARWGVALQFGPNEVSQEIRNGFTRMCTSFLFIGATDIGVDFFVERLRNDFESQRFQWDDFPDKKYRIVKLASGHRAYVQYVDIEDLRSTDSLVHGNTKRYFVGFLDSEIVRSQLERERELSVRRQAARTAGLLTDDTVQVNNRVVLTPRGAQRLLGQIHDGGPLTSEIAQRMIEAMRSVGVREDQIPEFMNRFETANRHRQQQEENTQLQEDPNWRANWDQFNSARRRAQREVAQHEAEATRQRSQLEQMRLEYERLIREQQALVSGGVSIPGIGRPVKKPKTAKSVPIAPPFEPIRGKRKFRVE